VKDSQQVIHVYQVNRALHVPQLQDEFCYMKMKIPDAAQVQEFHG
jgi:hypothetical protein